MLRRRAARNGCVVVPSFYRLFACMIPGGMLFLISGAGVGADPPYNGCKASLIFNA